MACQSISLLVAHQRHLPLSISSPTLLSKASNMQLSFIKMVSSPPRSPTPIVPAIFALAMDVPDYLPLQWNKAQDDKPLGPRFDMTAEEAISCQLEALRNNDHPHADYGVEVMYKFAGFDPFERSTYFGPFFDLGQFERFRRIFHHSTYRVLLGHKEAQTLSSLYVNEHCFKQRVWVMGARPNEEEIFEFTLLQRVGGCWDGYWLTQSLRHDGDGISGEHIDLGIKYDPSTSIDGMDFYLVLELAGYRVGSRERAKAFVGIQHRVRKEDAMKWFQVKYEGVILNRPQAITNKLSEAYCSIESPMIISVEWGLSACWLLHVVVSGLQDF
ncbi:hypothetical protein GOP47_0026297 [Adiantum capillus-veneris]|nr:hypothetical protein GOP47_0026297 [Adiantum capillus-veneris]